VQLCRRERGWRLAGAERARGLESLDGRPAPCHRCRGIWFRHTSYSGRYSTIPGANFSPPPMSGLPGVCRKGSFRLPKAYFSGIQAPVDDSMQRGCCNVCSSSCGMYLLPPMTANSRMWMMWCRKSLITHSRGSRKYTLFSSGSLGGRRRLVRTWSAYASS